MKRLFVFASATLLVLFLLNSFVLKEKEAGKKTTEATKSGPVPIVFRSTDGGQTWQDISKGLPENLQKEGVWSHGLFANDRGLYLRAGNGVYHSEPNSTTFFGQKISSLVNSVKLPLARMGYLHIISGDNFYKK